MKLCIWLLCAGVACSLSISVLSPAALQRHYPSGLLAQFGLVGEAPWGSYVAGKMWSVDSDCCNVCAPRGLNASTPGIFLVPRGQCTFETKLYNAQNAGAKAVLVYNTMFSLELDLMGSAGNLNVTIPSALISSTTAQNLKKTREDIILNMTFGSTSVSDKANIALVYAVKNDFDVEIVPALPAVLLFEGNVTVTPYFFVPTLDLLGFIIRLDCICNGLYCSIQHPYGDLQLRGVVRQQCVYRQSATYAPYVSYMTVWAKDCLSTPEQTCKAGFEAAGVSEDSVQQCYLESFGGSENGSNNTILAEAQRDFNSLAPPFAPLIAVEGDILYGAGTVANLKRLVCAHFNTTHAACSAYFCAPGCWPDMLSNLLCDPVCNVETCSFDNGACVNPLDLVPSRSSGTSTPTTNSTSTTNNTSTTNSTSTANSTSTTSSNATNTGTSGTQNDTTGNGALGTNNATNAPSANSTGNSNSTTDYGSWSGNNQTDYGTTQSGDHDNSTSPTNSTSFYDPEPNVTASAIPLNSSMPLDWECSSGCSLKDLQSATCLTACNNSRCDYQNWTCTCAPGCSPDLLENELCEGLCNTPRCDYDRGWCSIIALPASYFSTPQREEGSQEVMETPWKKWLVVSFSVMGFLAVLVVGVFCYIRRRASRRSRLGRQYLDQSGMRLNNSVSPVSCDSEHLTADKIIYLLGGQKFTPSIVEYGEKMCVVCMNEFLLDTYVCKTLCGHVFHYSCLQEWVRAKEDHPTCPLCGRHPMEAPLSSFRVLSSAA